MTSHEQFVRDVIEHNSKLEWPSIEDCEPLNQMCLDVLAAKKAYDEARPDAIRKVIIDAFAEC